MPNLYATPTEIKAAMPDAIRSTTTEYDALFLRLADTVSRAIDNHCRRVFFPSVAARHFSGTGTDQLWVSDLILITTVEISTDQGATFEELATSDYFGTYGGDFNDPRSHTLLVLAANGSRSTWPKGQRSVRITGVWGFTANRDEAWEPSGVALAEEYVAGGAVLKVADATVTDQWGIATAFHAGRLVKVQSELFEVTGLVLREGVADDVRVLPGRNGSAQAGHAAGQAIAIWRPPEPVKQAAVIQAVRQVERGFQGFGDARATPEIGQLFFIKALDPEAAYYLSSVRMEAVG